ncbi:voltage-dependent T-type calcium channel subunit alpha-1I-like [Alosa pseudoharengus]|uniref:voltage-dependent T-type calcium channel subunit alpha-1I-like n=1 Tax=Alosa pseudoharengus TaxID=34774 RepID=UPI003F8C73FC
MDFPTGNCIKKKMNNCKCIGSFFMINLCLVVIATQFSETKQREHQLMQEQRAQCLSSSTLASMAEPGDCYEELFQLVCHMLRKARRRSAAMLHLLGQCPAGGGGGGGGGPEHITADNPTDLALTPHTATAEACPFCSVALSLIDGAGPGDGSANEDKEAVSAVETDGKGSQLDGEGKGEGRTCKGRCRDVWVEVRIKLWGIVESKYFNRGIMIAILINTISMGIEHHEQPEELTNILEICNIVFTSMFALEMVLKLTAFGFFNYLRNPYNIFDGIIVIISVCEIIGQSDGGLSVLRTFRLLRVLKLVRFMPALRRQLVVLMKTMDNVATFCMLLMLFIFIFSILGMHIFGCKFSLKTEAGDTVPDRKNFDSLLWAIVTVFQILTQEDWNVVLYNGMASTSPLAALYFVALMTFGNYILFNLLIAILVEGFQAEGDANRSYSDDDRSSSNFDESEKHKDSLQLSDPKICTLTPNGHLEMGPLSVAARGVFAAERMSFALGSRKSSVISLGKSSLEQRSLSLRHSRRSSVYHHWGRPPPPAHPQSLLTRRSSWNSLGRQARGGSLRVRGSSSARLYSAGSAEHESLLGAPHHHHHHHHPPPPPHHPLRPLHPAQHHQRRDRRALSLELPELLQVPACGGGGGGCGAPLSSSGERAAGGEHQDCNGKAPAGPQAPLLGEVFPQVNCRKDKGELEEDSDYTLCFRVQKMIEVYRPDWCETREDWSVYLFSPQNKFRLLCQSIIAHKLFDYVVLAFIFLNCITVALERPKIHQGSLERVFLTVSNYIFTAIFVAEMTVKVVSKGLYLGERAYLRSSWNILDGFLVFVSLVDIVVSMAGGAKILGVLRVLRLLRTLRPLRVISRAPGLKLVVETLITSLKPIGNIVLICCAFFIIFGILGVQLFKGKFYYCVGLDVKNITNKSDCLSANYRWVHHKYNFDNLGQALMSLFVLASKDGWVNIMYHGLDAVGIDQQPIMNYSPWMLLYFISFLLIVSFFVLNMFVGVVVENFHKCRQHQEVEEAKRREEKRLRRMERKRRKAQKLPYYASYGHIRLMIHTFCTSHHLDLFITLIICINVVTMSLEHYSQPQSLETTLKYCNYFFSTTFVIETVLKLVAFGVRRFFKDRWNQLDLAIVLLSVMGITLEEIEINASLPINPTIIRIMRVLRIARVLKLLKMATGMRALLDTVVQALPQVGNLGLLFMLLFFIYAALGVELFGELVCNEEYQCEGMSRHATFENFGMAFLTLFQVSTGDNWNGIMKDTLRECPPGEYNCNPSLQFISPMYFVSFVLTAQFVLINVVVAVLMKHLDDSNKEAMEDAEMDAEIELELAQGALCCMGGLGAAAGGAAIAAAAAGGLGASLGPGGDRGGGGGGGGAGEGGCRYQGVTAASPHCPHGASSPRRNGHDARSRRRLYSPAQENQWLDSVSLLIKDSLEGEMLMIDNLSGSVFHHYSSPPVCRDCHHHPQEIQLAEVEQASLMSEQLSDKSSSLALPDDLSLDDHSVYQLLVRDSKRGSSDSHSSEELRSSQAHCGGSQPHSPRREEGETGLLDVCLGPQSPVQRLLLQQHQHTPTHSRDGGQLGGHIGGAGGGGGGGAGGGVSSSRGASPLFHLPAEFFHPASAVPQGSPAVAAAAAATGVAADRMGAWLTSPASWASLRSPGANSRVIGSQHQSHSDSSLATGSSEGSLQTTLEERLSFSISPPPPSSSSSRDRDPALPRPVLCPVPLPIPPPPATPSPRRQQRCGAKPSGAGVVPLQATRGHQRSQSSCGGSSGSPGGPRQDSMDPSDNNDDAGAMDCGSGQAGTNSEHLSEALSSLSLSSLRCSGSLAPPLAKKCNSTGSLEQGGSAASARGGKDSRQLDGMDAQGYLPAPWTGEVEERGTAGLGGDQGLPPAGCLGVKGSSQTLDASSRKNR